MTISKLLAELQAVLESHGDLPVFVQDGMDPSDLQEADAAEVRTQRQVPMADVPRVLVIE